MTKATEDKKPAAKKDAEKKADKPAAAKPKAKRTTAKITLTHTKVIEAQFDTTSKKVEELDKKLVEVEARFADKPDHQFAQRISEARAGLAAAQEQLVGSKDAFAEIGNALRDFFG